MPLSSPSAASLTGLAGPLVAELRRKAHARLAERVDLVRNRHKPLSILRAEGRRVVDACLDQESTTLSRTERDRLGEDILAESPSFGPLEELFRDEAVREILVLAPQQIIALKGENWSPTSQRFRDAEQWQSVLARWVEVGESLSLEPATAVLVDVRLANGFRVVSVVPPAILGVPPQALLVRGAIITTPMPMAYPSSAAGTMSAFPTPARSPFGPARPLGGGGGSQALNFPPPRAVPTTAAGPASATNIPRPVPPDAPRSSAFLTQPAPDSAPPAFDPHAKLRQRVAGRIVSKLAGAGVYDLNQIPLPELRRIIQANVEEISAHDRLGLDGAATERLALEILAGMNR